jgi:hypothetical protein
MMLRSERITTAALAIALLGGPLVDEAAAGKKPRLSARINGHAVRAGGRRLDAVYVGMTVLTISGSTRNVRFNRAVAFACVAFGLAPTTSPVTLTTCNGLYQETRTGLHPSVKIWTTDTGLQVTIESFDGVHARGTFSGAFEFSPTGDAPAVIVNGRFSVVVRAT